MRVTITSGHVHTITLPDVAPLGQTVTVDGRTFTRDRELLEHDEDGKPIWRMFWRDEAGTHVTTIDVKTSD